MRAFFRGILRVFTIILSLLLTLAVFLALFFGVVFKALYPSGGARLAALLSGYPIVKEIPRLFYSDDELEVYCKVYNAGDNTGEAYDETEAAATEGPATLVVVAATPAPVSTPDDFSIGGIAVSPAATEEVAAEADSETSPASTPAPTEEPVQYGRTVGSKSIVFRSAPNFNGKGVLSVAPDTVCIVLGKEGNFYKVMYLSETYYVHQDMFELIENDAEESK